MNKEFCIWTALTVIAATFVAMMFGANTGWSICGGVMAVLLLGLRDRVEVGYRLSDRENALQTVAQQLGFSFAGGRATNFNILGWSGSFLLTESAVQIKGVLGQTGLGERLLDMCYQASNVMRLQTADRTIAVFDICRPSNAHEDESVRQTVFSLRSPQLEFPHFALKPAHGGERISARFSSSIKIKAGYRCYGDPPSEMEDLLRNFSEIMSAGYVLEAGDGCLLLYRDERANRGQTLLEAYEIEFFVQQSRLLYQEIAHSIATCDSSPQRGYQLA